MKLIRYLTLALVLGFVIFLTTVGGPGAVSTGAYRKIPLVSDMPGAPHQDMKMKNPWGMASLGGSDPFWINDEGSGVSELIDGQGNIIVGLPFVTIPARSGMRGPSHPTGVTCETCHAGPAPRSGMRGPSHPTGIVANTTSQFALTTGGPALFIFDTLDGTISGWNSGMLAHTVFSNPNKQYTGLAMATNAGNPFLYAANAKGSIDVFDGSFGPVTTTGGFVDSHLPNGLTPYGIANIDGNLFVTYSKRFQKKGAVDEFDPNGNLIRRFATDATGTTGRKLNQPWAVAMAPRNFGQFSNDLLIGNFGDGTISAFNPTTGVFLGQLAETNGRPMKISGLWALMVGEGVEGVTDPNAVYFTAGPNAEMDGLFGLIKALPPPSPTPTKRATPTRTATATKTATPTPTPTATPNASMFQIPTAAPTFTLNGY